MGHRQSIDVRVQDQPVDLLDAPPALHELPGQPVDQVLMSRPAAIGAKIAGGGHQSVAEVVLPDAVDHHPGRQGVFPTGNPLGQQLTAAAHQAVHVDRVGVSGDGAQETGLDLIGPQSPVAPGQDVGGDVVLEGRVSHHVGLGVVVTVDVGVGEAAGHEGDLAGPFLLFRTAQGVLGEGDLLLFAVGPVLEVLGGDQQLVLDFPLGQLLAEGLGVLLDLFEVLLPGLLAGFPPLRVLQRHLVLVEGQILFLEIHRREEGFDPEIVLLGKGIILVVVALGASQGQAHEHRAGGVDHVCDVISPPLLPIGFNLDP